MRKEIISIMLVLVLMLGVGCSGSNLSTTETVKQIATNDFCSNNPVLDISLRLQNSLSNTITYEAGTVYLKNLDTGSITEQTINSGFTTLSDVLNCKSEKGYEVVIKTTQDNDNGGDKYMITPDMLQQDPVEITMQMTNHTLFKWKAYDNDNRAKLFGYLGSASGTNVTLPTTDYVTHNGTGTYVATVVGGTAKTVATDGFIDYTFTLAPVTSNEQGGKDAVLCVNYADDSNSDDWSADSLELIFDGQALSQASLDANDIVGLNAYEICFDMPYAIGSNGKGGIKTQHTLDFRITAQSGINPDMDLVLRYVELGSYQSQKDASKILSGIGFQDSTSRTALGTAYNQLMTIDVS